MSDETPLLKRYVADLVLVQDSAGLTDWEKDFVCDMERNLASGRVPTPKQKNAVLKLVEKYDL